MCGLRFFMRAAGIVHSERLKSISSHVAFASSLLRTKVSMSNLVPALMATLAPTSSKLSMAILIS